MGISRWSTLVCFVGNLILLSPVHGTKPSIESNPSTERYPFLQIMVNEKPLLKFSQLNPKWLSKGYPVWDPNENFINSHRVDQTGFKNTEQIAKQFLALNETHVLSPSLLRAFLFLMENRLFVPGRKPFFDQHVYHESIRSAIHGLVFRAVGKVPSSADLDQMLSGFAQRKNKANFIVLMRDRGGVGVTSLLERYSEISLRPLIRLSPSSFFSKRDLIDKLDAGHRAKRPIFFFDEAERLPVEILVTLQQLQHVRPLFGDASVVLSFHDIYGQGYFVPTQPGISSVLDGLYFLRKRELQARTINLNHLGPASFTMLVRTIIAQSDGVLWVRAPIDQSYFQRMIHQWLTQMEVRSRLTDLEGPINRLASAALRLQATRGYSSVRALREAIQHIFEGNTQALNHYCESALVGRSEVEKRELRSFREAMQALSVELESNQANP